MSGKKKYKTAGEFLRYLRGELSGRERHAFERELEADPFEKEALEGLESLSGDEAEEDILSLHARLRKRLSRRAFPQTHPMPTPTSTWRKCCSRKETARVRHPISRRDCCMRSIRGPVVS